MDKKAELRFPWLIAVWPGMGAVAQIAGAHLVEQLGAAEIESLPVRSSLDLDSVEVVDGLVVEPRAPRGRMFAWRDPVGRRDLLVFVGEKQPGNDGYAYCRALVARAVELGVTRVLTFAAMASGLHPRATPRVQVAATVGGLLAELKEHGADPLVEGQIAGMNGVLLAAAAASGIEAACLLGEMPFFATQLPNPKASRAILGVFADLTGVDLDFDEFDVQVRAAEAQLVHQLDELQRASRAIADSAARALQEPAADSSSGSDPEQAGGPAPGLSLDVEAQIEDLFLSSATDRRRGVELKRLLDRHGVYERYEDRFLDLFRKR